MDIIVKKFGGTSVGSTAKIQNIAKEIASHKSKYKQIIIVSAMSGETNRLLALAQEISSLPAPQDIDIIATTGEQVTTGLLSMALNSLGCSAIGVLAWQIPIITDDNHTSARVQTINSDKITEYLSQYDVIIISGFQGVTNNNRLTTLGRGGSDTSAVAIAVAVGAMECQIFTDVDGVYNADPNTYSGAHKIPQINSTLVLEMATLGAKVLHARSCELGFRHNVNIQVLSSFNYTKTGTIVSNKFSMEEYPIITLNKLSNQAHINIKIANNQVIADIYRISNIDMLQVSNGQISFCCELDVLTTIEKYLSEHNYIYTIQNNLTKLSLVGSGFRSNNQQNAKVWQTLSSYNIISTTHNEISVSVLINNDIAKTLYTSLSELIE